MMTKDDKKIFDVNTADTIVRLFYLLVSTSSDRYGVAKRL